VTLSVPPIADPDSAPYWAGCEKHQLLVQRCTDCGARRFPPAPVCDLCRGSGSDWTPLAGPAFLYSWIVVHQQILPEFSDVPYVVGLAEFEPRVRIPGRVQVADPAACRAGMPLAVVFRQWGDGVVVPEFRAADGPEPAS
jgi:uncharacterized OB-fold protein